MTALSEIGEVLRLLGVSRNLSGHRLTAAAVLLTIEKPERLLSVTKELYPAVAVQYDCSWQCVERAIRSAAARAWLRNPQYLTQLARYPLSGAPTSSEFVDILASYFLRSEIQSQ